MGGGNWPSTWPWAGAASSRTAATRTAKATRAARGLFWIRDMSVSLLLVGTRFGLFCVAEWARDLTRAHRGFRLLGRDRWARSRSSRGVGRRPPRNDSSAQVSRMVDL